MTQRGILLFMALIAFAFCAECLDGSTCEGTGTCCEVSIGYGCCPYENGVCCTDKIHCCPSQTTCDIERFQCKRDLLSFLFSGPNYLPMAEVKQHQLQFTFDWEAFIKCLLNSQPVMKEVMELIEAILAKDYNKAIQLIYKIIEDGSALIKECLKVITQDKRTIDWDAILKCLKKFAPLVPEVMELIKAIEQGDYVKAMTLMYELIEKGITIVQECFGPMTMTTMNETQIANWDWDAFLQCLLKAEPVAKDILELIEAIQKGDYIKATTLVFQLIKDGSEVIIQCLKV